jgi:hypothetical protein
MSDALWDIQNPQSSVPPLLSTARMSQISFPFSNALLTVSSHHHQAIKMSNTLESGCEVPGISASTPRLKPMLEDSAAAESYIKTREQTTMTFV